MNVTSPCFERWHEDMLAGDKELWSHLHEMELGVHGGFSQRLFMAMDKADSSNQQRLYNALPELFNPRF